MRDRLGPLTGVVASSSVGLDLICQCTLISQAAVRNRRPHRLLYSLVRSSGCVIINSKCLQYLGSLVFSAPGHTTSLAPDYAAYAEHLFQVAIKQSSDFVSTGA